MVGMQATRYGYHQLEEMALRAFDLDDLERRVGHFLLMSLPYKQIASHMHLSESSIKRCARTIFEKANVKNRSEFEYHIHQMIERL